jgi:tetratricopeptide (TPR) repeat protein
MSALLLAAGLMFSAAPAGPNPYLAQARVLYQGLEYEKALVKLKRAEETPGLPDAEHVEVLVYIGLCRYQLGDEAAARTAFRAALKADPAVRLPPLTSPKIVAVFNAEVAKAAPPPTETPKATEPPKLAETPKAAPEPAVAAATTTTTPTETAATGKPGKVIWPTLVAAGVAAALVGTAAYFGKTASDRAAAARRADYASDAASISKDAQNDAHIANGLYAAAGGVAALGVVFIIVF